MCFLCVCVIYRNSCKYSVCCHVFCGLCAFLCVCRVRLCICRILPVLLLLVCHLTDRKEKGESPPQNYGNGYQNRENMFNSFHSEYCIVYTSTERRTAWQQSALAYNEQYATGDR